MLRFYLKVSLWYGNDRMGILESHEDSYLEYSSLGNMRTRRC